ncbi:hypothetical protein SOVF_038650 [Spinacia oleracea]|nr:hypothetical protein SOVF_038650 [Spinacia oleracea]
MIIYYYDYSLVMGCLDRVFAGMVSGTSQLFHDCLMVSACRCMHSGNWSSAQTFSNACRVLLHDRLHFLDRIRYFFTLVRLSSITL